MSKTDLGDEMRKINVWLHILLKVDKKLVRTVYSALCSQFGATSMEETNLFIFFYLFFFFFLLTLGRHTNLFIVLMINSLNGVLCPPGQFNLESESVFWTIFSFFHGNPNLCNYCYFLIIAYLPKRIYLYPFIYVLS